MKIHYLIKMNTNLTKGLLYTYYIKIIQYFWRQHDTRKNFQLIYFNKAKVEIYMELIK